MVATDIALPTILIAFNRKFPCRREALTSFLRAVEEHGGKQEDLSRDLGYGRPFLEGFRNWSKNCLLLTDDWQLTPLANRLLQIDPAFEKTATQWLLHTVLCMTNPFWRWIFGRFLSYQNTFTIDQFFNSAKEIGVKESYRPHVTAILTSYTDEAAFGGLGILTKVKNGFAAGQFAAPCEVSAWALFHYVRSKSLAVTQSQETSLDECRDLENGPLVGLFSNLTMLDRTLEELQTRGWITLRRYAHPYTLAVDVTEEEQIWRSI